MVLDKLGDSLRGTLKKLANTVFINDTVLNEIIKDIQRALIQSDVNVKLVLSLTNTIKDRAKNEELPTGLSKREQLINIVYEELTQFLGGEFEPLKIGTKKPFTIMLVGLFGNGKTTAIGKLGKYYTKRGFKVAAIQTDTWRPAAFEQLKQNSEKAGITFFGESPDPSRKTDPTYPTELFQKYEKSLQKFDIILVDTAGRDALSEDLITELTTLHKAVKPDETLLVMNADIGQTAEKQAQAFHDSCGVSGVIISKMDGTAKGGGALSACAITKAPVKFIGTGEKIDDLEEFKPKNFVGRLLGMGDLEALLEKAQEAMNEEDAEDLAKRMMKGQFTLKDLYEQMQAMKKMGPLTKVVDMIPGMGGMNLPKEAIKEQEQKMESWKILMDSCTKEELNNPEIITVSRIERIAQGSGRSEKDLRELLKQHKQSKKMMKMLKGSGGNEKNMQKMMKRMGGMKGMQNMKF
ncbi:MAG: signal recognition particle protein Srp54 [Candidatus Woesearchaeota archaeon]